MKYPEATLRGDSYEMGEQIGRHFKASIRESLRNWVQSGKEERIAYLAQRYKQIIHASDRSYLEEIEGIMAGAGLSEWEAIYLHVRWEMDELMSTEADVNDEHETLDGAQNNEGCSTFAFGGEMTRAGQVYCGTNHDVSVWSRKQVAVLRMLPPGGTSLFMLAYPGSIALDGMNQHGLCLCGNSLYGIKQKGGKPGLPHGVFKRMLLRQRSVGACLDLAERLAREGRLGFSGNFTICDADGDMACLELINGCLDIIRPQPMKNCVLHTNHLQSKRADMLALQGDISQSSNTVERLEQLTRLVDGRARNIDLRWVQAMLSDHERYPKSICSHVGEKYHTAYSLIMLPKSREAWVTVGNPCSNHYYKIDTGLQR